MSVSGDWADLSVLHIGAGRYRPGDTNHSTFDIWRELAKGFRRYTAVGRSTQAQHIAFAEGGVAVRLLASRMKSEAEFLLAQYQVESIAAEVKPDVVIAQCPVQGGLVAARIAKRYGAKVLMEFHMGHYFEDKPLISRNGILERITRGNLPHADRIRVLSVGMHERLLAKYGADYATRTVVLPPRVDLACFSRVKEDWGIVGRPKIVMVGSVNSRKGQLRFLQTILPSHPDIEVWIVGAGPDLDACKSLAERTDALDRVKILGQMGHSELADLLPRADAMVLFSNMEGTPRAIMEGMAAGLPIITTNAGFCADVVENGVQGFVLGDDPTAEIVECLERLLGDNEMRARMGQAARARAVAEFDADKLYYRYRALIRETAEA